MMVTQTLIRPARPAERTWPATALTVGIGVFSAVALGAVATKPLRGAALTGTDGIIVLACALRFLTVVDAGGRTVLGPPSPRLAAAGRALGSGGGADLLSGRRTGDRAPCPGRGAPPDLAGPPT